MAADINWRDTSCEVRQYVYLRLWGMEGKGGKKEENLPDYMIPHLTCSPRNENLSNTNERLIRVRSKIKI